MKYIKYVLLIMILLVGCQTIELNIEPVDETLYADFELGVNFTDYMRLQYEQNPDVHVTLFTHKVDYVIPQVFYYLPMSLELDTKKAWEDYFENWLLAVENEDLSYVNHYLQGTNIEGFINHKFEEQPLLSILKILINENKKVYIEAFDKFEKKEWPDIQETLYSRARYLNETLISQRVASKWQEETGFNLPTYKVSLSYYDNEDLELVSIAYDKMVISYQPELDITELSEQISYFYGKELIELYIKPLVEEMMEKYSYLDEPVYEYLVNLTQNIIFSYHEDLFGVKHEKDIEIPSIVSSYQKIEKSHAYFERAFIWYLEDLKKDKPYIVDDQLHYLRKIYNQRVINEDVTLFYYPSYPIVIQNKEGLNVLTNDMDMVPEVSPNGKKLLFVSPFEFEMIGDLYVYDVDKNILEKVIEKTGQNTVKAAKWYTNNQILFIEGYAYGTVSLGGILNLLDLNTLEVVELVSGENDYEEITNVYNENGIWYYDKVTHDENFMNYVIKKYRLELKDAQ